MRVLVETLKPLKGWPTWWKKWKVAVVFLKYERLPVYYYICGRIGHNTMKCSQYSKELSPTKFQYGNWLRVKLTSHG